MMLNTPLLLITQLTMLLLLPQFSRLTLPACFVRIQLPLRGPAETSNAQSASATHPPAAGTPAVHYSRRPRCVQNGPAVHHPGAAHRHSLQSDPEQRRPHCRMSPFSIETKRRSQQHCSVQSSSPAFPLTGARLNLGFYVIGLGWHASPSTRYS